MTVADRIKQKRESLGLTQDELAKKLGYSSKSAVSRTENAGDDIGRNRIIKFAEALGTTPAYLMGWTEQQDNIENSQIKRFEAYFQLLTPDLQKQATDYLKFLANQQASQDNQDNSASPHRRAD